MMGTFLIKMNLKTLAFGSRLAIIQIFITCPPFA
jgi:hypothetical protein